MNLLAFDTSTERLSIALSCSGGAPDLWTFEGPGAAQASTTLIAGVLDLLAQAALPVSALDAICFGSGPGSFTGLRTACAVAQGLAFGADVPVLPVDSLLAVAEAARFEAMANSGNVADAAAGTDAAERQEGEVTALLDARMDEIYAARYAFSGSQWRRLEPTRLLRPEQVVGNAAVFAGNVFEVYAGRLALDAGARCVRALPEATAMLRLAPQLLEQGLAVPAEEALPVYIRDKVAQTTDERAALQKHPKGR